MDEQHYSLRATIDRFEEKMAVLKLEDGQILNWPIKQLPDDLKEGSTIRLVISTEATQEKEREKIAKTLLNQILNDNQD